MKSVLMIFIMLAGFYLGNYNGHLAFWDSKNQTPLEIYPYAIDIYTQSDQVHLKEGIKVATSKELASLIDDYTS